MSKTRVNSAFGKRSAKSTGAAVGATVQQLEGRQLFSTATILQYALAPLGVPITLSNNVRPTSTVGSGTGDASNTNTGNVNLGDVKIDTPYGNTVMVGTGVHVNALASTFDTANPDLEVQYNWDFGDAAGAYNAYDGFNAAHVYSKAGVYTVKLTMTEGGATIATAQTYVQVTADARKKVYVSSSAGSDSNTGLSASSPVATVAKGLTVAGNNGEVLLKAGDTWDLTTTARVTGTNIYIGSYGTGAQPVLRRAASSVANLIYAANTSSQVTVSGIAFDSTTPTDLEKTGGAEGVRGAGSNLVVMDSTFLNVSTGVNGEEQPNGVLVINDTAPNLTSVRAYFTWIQGKDWVVVGNTAVNSTREHIMRVGGADHVNAEYNTFANEASATDSKDISKGVFTSQVGSFVNIANNKITDGPVGVGPLGGIDGIATPQLGMTDYVFRRNVINNSSFNVSPGISHVLIEDNVITENGYAAINITAVDSTTNASTGAKYYPNRNIADLTFSHNTAFNSLANGRFLTLQQASNAGQISLISNLYVAPKLETGYNQNAAVYVSSSDLGSFASISGNIWPVPAKSPGSLGSAIYVYSYWWNALGYITPAAYLLLSPVKGDVFSTVQMSDPTVQGAAVPNGPTDYTATVGTLTAGSRLRR